MRRERDSPNCVNKEEIKWNLMAVHNEAKSSSWNRAVNKK